MDILMYELNNVKVVEIISVKTLFYKADDLLMLLKNSYFIEFDCIILHHKNIASPFYLETDKTTGKNLQKTHHRDLLIAIVGCQVNDNHNLIRFVYESELSGKIIVSGTPLQAIKMVKKIKDLLPRSRSIANEYE